MLRSKRASIQTSRHKPVLLKKQYRWKKKSKLIQEALLSFKMVVLTSFLITAGCLFYIWQWTNYLHIGYQTQALENDKKELQNHLGLLKTEINFLTRPQRIEAIATKRAHMDNSTISQYFELPSASKK